MEISTKTFALWEFFVDIFIISYCYVFQKKKQQQQDFSLCSIAANAKLQGSSTENAQSQNFLWEWLVIVMFIIEQTKNILRVTSSFINNE